MYVDSHAHVTSSQFDADRDDVIQRALDAGVHTIINPATDLDDSRRAIDLAEKHSGLFACVGWHPHEAAKATDAALADVETLSSHARVVAIGEIGLDYYYDFAPRDVQIGVFQAQLEMAARRDLPVVIHTRDSINETLEIVEDAVKAHPAWRSAPPLGRGVFHCFSGDIAAARRAIGLGFMISFPGMVTFKKATTAVQVVSEMPLECLMLETDSPYLAPIPLRGKRNEPSNIPLIAARVADLQQMSIADIAAVTSRNARTLFGLPAGSR